MSKPSHDTWMPFYPGAYLRQTGRLTTAQHGAYLLLLLEAWAHDGLIPADDDELAQITRMSAREWRANKAKVLRFWTAVEGGYRQERLDQELARAKHLVAVKSEAGKASAEARKRERIGNGRSTPVATPVATDEQQTGRPSQSPYSVSNETDAHASIDPDKKAWQDGVALLMSRGVDERPARQFIGKLVKEIGGEARALLPIIARCIEIGSEDPQSYLRKAVRAHADRRGGGSAPPLPLEPDEPINWRIRVDAWRRDRTWVVSLWGPPPGEPGCMCPAELLEAA